MTDASSPASTTSELSRVLAKLDRLEDRLSRLERSVTSLDGAIQSTPNAIATITDTVDGVTERLVDRGVDIDERIQRLLRLLEKSTEPRALDALEGLLETAKQLPLGAAALADTFDSTVARLAEAGIDVDERLQVLLQVAERLTAPEALAVVTEVFSNVDAIQRLLESGVFGPGAVHVVGRAARALGRIDFEDTKPVGPLGALRAIWNPDVQRALGFALEFGQRFGQCVQSADHCGASPTSNGNGTQVNGDASP